MSETVADALSVVVSTFESDGYLTEIEERPDVIVLRIRAGEDACEDCLSPRSILEPMITHALRRAGFPQRLELIYPGAGNTAL